MQATQDGITIKGMSIRKGLDTYLPFWFTLLVGILVPFAPVHGIIIRHDVQDALYLKEGQKYHCLAHFPMGEGTAISSRWILTAGHLGMDLIHQMKIGYRPTVEVGNQEFDIEKVFVYDYFRQMQNDLALVKVKGEISNIQFPKIYDKRDEIGKRIVIAGSGDSGTGETGPLKKDQTPRAASNQIEGADQQWIWFRFDAPGSANTTELEGSSGPGDSGGPAFTELNGELYVLGVGSHQRGQGKQGVYGVLEYYTRISTYASWIHNTVSKE